MRRFSIASRSTLNSADVSTSTAMALPHYGMQQQQWQQSSGDPSLPRMPKRRGLCLDGITVTSLRNIEIVMVGPCAARPGTGTTLFLRSLSLGDTLDSSSCRLGRLIF